MPKLNHEQSSLLETHDPNSPPPSTPKRGGRGGSGRGGVYRIGSYHAGMRTGSSRNPSSDQRPQHRSHRPAIVPKWHGVVPRRCTEKLAATPIVQATTKLTSVPRRMPKLGSRRPASASQSQIPEKQLQSRGQYPRPARQPPTGASWRAGRRGIGHRPWDGWKPASEAWHHAKTGTYPPEFRGSRTGLGQID